MWPHGLKHARLLCPSLSPGVCSNSCPLSQWCYLTISSPSSLFPFSFSVFPSIGVLSNEVALLIKWPKYWSFSFHISLSNEYSALISSRVNWFDLLAFQGTIKSRLQHHRSKAQFFNAQPSLWFLTSVYDYWKNHNFDCMDLCWQSNVSAF